MSLKYSSTTADYLVWSDAMNLIRKLAKDENYKISLLIYTMFDRFLIGGAEPTTAPLKLTSIAPLYTDKPNDEKNLYG